MALGAGTGVNGPLGAGVNGNWVRGFPTAGDNGIAVTMPGDPGDRGRAEMLGVATFAELGALLKGEFVTTKVNFGPLKGDMECGLFGLLMIGEFAGNCAVGETAD